MTETFDLAAMAAKTKPALFSSGRVVVTSGIENRAKQELPESLLNGYRFAQILVTAHTRGIWGDLPPEDAELNREALIPGKEGRIMSVFHIGDRKIIWLITEWDRSVTTLLFPEEY